MMSATSTIFQSHSGPGGSSHHQQQQPKKTVPDGASLASTAKSTEAGNTTIGTSGGTGPSGTYETKDLSTAIDELLGHHIATSLHTLSTRNQSINEVCDHLEQQYLSSKRLGGDDQSHYVVHQTKEQLTRAIEIMNHDLSTIATQFDTLLNLQDSSISSITSQVELLNARINGIKSQHLKNSLQEMQLPLQMATTSMASAHQVAAVRDISPNDVILPRHIAMALGSANPTATTVGAAINASAAASTTK